MSSRKFDPIGMFPAYGAQRTALLVRINNLSDLSAAYGADCVRQAIRDASRYRLGFLGISGKNLSFVADYIVVSLADIQIPELVSDDLFLERIKAAFCQFPIDFGQYRALLSVYATFSLDDQLARMQEHAQAARVIEPDSVSSTRATAYRNDMEVATDFFKYIRTGLIVLAFQPVVSASDHQKTIYTECLLRRPVGGGGLGSCQYEVMAIERLGLIDRLDRSVLWTVIETLQDNPSLHLGCNISALSLRHDRWWHLLQNHLVECPGVAERLTLEINGTRAIAHSDEAINLLRTLSFLGCRIALDDLGAGMDFLARSGADIVKVDRELMTHSHGESPSPLLLRHLTARCAESSVWVVVKLIESEAQCDAAVHAGAHCVQGYFLEKPSISPPWLRAPVSVRDSLAAGHRCLSSNNASCESFLLAAISGSFRNRPLEREGDA